MTRPGLLLLRGNDIVDLLSHREAAILDAVEAAYVIKESGDCSIPNCEFLRFPGDAVNRIIPKPAYLGGSFAVAGIKWVASFPDNLSHGIERASATLILNSPETGVPFAMLEGSLISAYRTAAAATLAAKVLRGANPIATLGIIGCGLINFETLRFMLTVWPGVRTVLLFDMSVPRAAQFRLKCAGLSGTRQVSLAASPELLLQQSEVVSVATTASDPHLSSRGNADVILHTSLRDFWPSVILEADNIVDDVDHVCSNRTSLHLTEQREGHRGFIRGTIGAILNGSQPARAAAAPVIFSPFGLAVLDLALAKLTYDLACEEKAGTFITDFMPDPWVQRSYFRDLSRDHN